MYKKPIGLHALVPSLVLALTAPLAAQTNLFLGGPLQSGFGRPPLRVNVQPATSVYYTPAQIRHAYGFDQLTANGAGQIIAVVDAYGNGDIQADLNTFSAQFGLPATTVQVLGSGSPDLTWELETALDVEWVHALAPNATIILSVAASASTGDLLNAVAAAVNAGANVVSMSWGSPEFSGEQAYDSYFQAPGVAFVASAGDNGELTNGVEVEWPAVSPYVISVGGTTLLLDANNNRTSETAWCNSGGGLSTIYAVPPWQTGWSSYSYRGVPDVSYNADPNTGVMVYDFENGGWFSVGGTSAGAPQWAALIALANQSRATGIMGATNLYAVAGTAPTINPAIFFDITSGSNGVGTQAEAVVGYDLVTGLGSPVVAGLVPALIALAPSPDFTIALSPSSQSVTTGARVSYTVTVTPLNGNTENVNLTVTLPSGATNASFSVNPIPGSSGTSVLTFTAPATAGTNTVTVTGTGAVSGKTHQATAKIVTTAPDFSLSATPASNSVRHGSSVNYSVTVTPSGGFTGTVALTGVVSPSKSNGPTVSFNPTQITGGSGSSTMTAKTSSSTPTGTYTITITGTSGSTKHTTAVTLTVN